MAGKERGVIPARRPGAMVYALAFAPDGQALAAACGEEARHWDLGTTGRRPAGEGRSAGASWPSG